MGPLKSSMGVWTLGKRREFSQWVLFRLMLTLEMLRDFTTVRLRYYENGYIK